jgi:hypothetical protein
MHRLLRSPAFALGGWALAIVVGVVAILLATNRGTQSGAVHRSDEGKVGSALLDQSTAEEEHDFFNIVVHTLDPARMVGVFPYLRDLPSGAHWTDGDRNAYRCAYMFLLDARNQVVGRVTFAALEQSKSYVQVNDRYMAESHERPVARYYDGEPIPIDPDTGSSGWNTPERNCRVATEEYASGVPEGPVPVIKFVGPGGNVLETRDYAKVYKSTTRGHDFRIVERSPDSVTVLAYEDGEPLMAVYYDRLSSQITLKANVTELAAGHLDPDEKP